MQPIELAVIINCFNRCQLLSEALPSVIHALRQISVRASIVIFEAGSTDGSLEFIKNYSLQVSDITIHCLTPSPDVDRSFSAGCNYAVRFASCEFPELKYLFFYETDNLITNAGALTIAIHLLENKKELAAVGFTVERFNQHKAGFGSRFPTVLSFVLGQQISNRLGLERMPIKWQEFQGHKWGFSDIVYTSPLLVRHFVWQATGGMDAKNFPFSDCDNDWCWSVHEQGWYLGVLDMSGVIHDNQMYPSSWSANRVLDFHRARFRLLYKHREKINIVLLKPILLIRHCLEAVLLLMKVAFSERARQSFQQRLILLRTVLDSYELL